jgi:ABC-type glycerol-3-phosphate transport system substrate-binding protein
LSKKILSDEYVLKDSGTVLGNAVPIKSATMLICWNKELAASLGIKNIPERLRKGKMYELHCEAAKNMPVDFYAGGHIWDYLCVKGLKNGSDSIDLEFLEKRLDEFARFSGIMNMFITEQKYSLEFVDYFLKGQLLFYMGSSTHLFFYGKDMPFETGAMFCGPEKGCKLSRAGIYLGVYKNSVNKKAAFEFIDYMISEQAQNMIACELWDTPCLKKSSLLFRDIFEQTDKKSIDEYFKGCPLLALEQSSSLARQQYFLNSETRDVLNGLMKGDFDSKQAAGIIFNRWKDFSNE